MNKKIKITESQYKRIFLKEQEDNDQNDSCLEKNLTRLYFIKKDLMERYRFNNFKLNPNSGKGICHLMVTLNRGDKTLSWTFYEKPNLVYINIKGDNLNFNITGELPNLEDIQEIKLRGYYKLTGDVTSLKGSVDTDQLGTSYYIKNGKRVETKGDEFVFFNDLTIARILEWFDLAEKDANGYKDSIKPEITEEMEEIVSDYASEIGGYTDQENFDNMMKIIYNNFKNDCNGVRSFVYSYGILKKENIIEETQDVSLFGFDDEYQEYRDLLVMILDKGNRGICDSGDWDRLKKAIS